MVGEGSWASDPLVAGAEEEEEEGSAERVERFLAGMRRNRWRGKGSEERESEKDPQRFRCTF